MPGRRLEGWSMRRMSVVAIMFACAVSIGYGQRIVKPEEFKQAMTIIGNSVTAGSKIIASGSYEDAKAPFVLARQTLASTVPFWRDRKNDSAAALAETAKTKLDELDKALSLERVDAAAVATALKNVTDACSTCHRTYREGDRQTGFRIKEGS